MADVQRGEASDDVPWLRTWLVRVIFIYWLATIGAAIFAYQTASGQEAHRELDLHDKGLLTAGGKVDRAVVATLTADAARNQACRDAHPPPPGETSPWFPEECAVYLPEEAATDVEAANWAAAHPDGANVAGWGAATAPLVIGAIGFVVLAAAALALRWITIAVRSRRARRF